MDWTFLLGCLVFSVVCIAFWVSWRKTRAERHRIDASWAAIAARLGGSLTPSTSFSAASILLSRGDLRVLVDQGPAPTEDDPRPYTRITVYRPQPVGDPRPTFAAGLRLRSSGLRGSNGPQIDVGDRRFESLVIQGEETSVLAVLDAETRAIVLDCVVTKGATVENDAVRWQVRGAIEDGDRLEEIVRDLLGLAERLRNPGAALPERLARNAAEDPVAEVRLANLRALQGAFPAEESARGASRAALGDEAPTVRLAAAQFLGEEGAATLRELVAGGPSIEAGIRSRALHLLVERAPRESVLPLLDRILDDPPSPWRRATAGGAFEDDPRFGLWRQAAAACGALRHAGATARLVAALGRLGIDPPSAAVVAEALGAIGDPTAETALIELLGTDDTDAAVAAARALGRVGTAAAVESLLARADGVFTSLALKQASREAIAAIQDRLPGAQRGQLGLAEAVGAQGQLSVPEPSEDGRLSLSNPHRPEGASETG